MRPPLLSVQDIAKHFDGISVLRGVTYSFAKGGVYGLLGPNGSGKTTLLNIISGYLKKDRGRVLFKHLSVGRSSPSALARMGVARTFQSVKLFGSLSVSDNLLTALRDKPDDTLWGAAFGQHAGKSPRWNEKVSKLLEEFYLTEVRNHLANELSFGQQKLLHLAMAMANPSEILLLDEPVGSLQSRYTEQISEKLHNLNLTMLIVEHNLEFIRHLASEVLFLNGGRIVASGAFDDVMADPEVRGSYL